MIAFAMVGDISNRHEVEDLRCEPVVKIIWTGANEVAGDEDVEDCRQERDFFFGGYCDSLIPTTVQIVH